MTTSPSRQPIFIHALFRTGSTYLFETFRRLGDRYTCFQEPLHEIALHAKTDRAILDGSRNAEKVNVLRHPPLSRSYFHELYEVADACLPHLQERDIYDGYFGTDTSSGGIDYWQSLVDNASGRAVIQECRSAGRIAAIRHHLGGHHAYLWRNPWDQWWSYQVSPYFDLTTQLIFNASSRPLLVQLVSSHIGFQPLPSQPLEVAYDHFARRPLTPDHAYQAFYTLWLLGLHEACGHADQLINIDQLSACSAARRETEAALQRVGVSGHSLEDCHSPVSAFTDEEQARFNALEQDIHQLWIKAGLPESDLQRLLGLRQQAAPERHTLTGQGAAMVNELSRYRDLLRRRHEDMAALHQQSDAKLQTAHRREDALREQLAGTEQKNDWLEHQAHLHKNTAEALDQRLNSSQQLLSEVLHSRSWRVTAPIRKSVLLARRVPGVTGSLGAVTSGAGGVRGALRKSVIDLIAATERRTHRHPRLRQALLAIAFRMPWLKARLRRLRHNSQPGVAERPVSLTPRSRDIYRQLVAAINDINTQHPSKESNETPD